MSPTTAPSRSRNRWLRPRYVVPAVVVGVVAVGVPVTMTFGRGSLGVSGPRDGGLVGKAQLAALTFRVQPANGDLSGVRLTFDGRPVTGTRDGKALVFSPTGLTDGKHTFSATAPGSLPLETATTTRTFTVDTTAPTLTMGKVPTANALREAVTVTGHATGAKTVTAGGRKVAVTNGAFSLHFDQPPAGLQVVAADAAGNRTTDTLTVPVKHPDMHGVHMTGQAWAYAPLRNPVLAMIRQHKIDTIELDIKDEDGIVNYDTGVALAHTVGAVQKLYDPATVIKQLHGMGVRVVGRIVCFRDPKLASWAWKHGHKNWDVQSPSGGPYNSSYGTASFTNFSNSKVQGYNIALADDAAKAGFDDIMYDYVRRPDGPLSAMRFPDFSGSPKVSVANFVRDTRTVIRQDGAFLGLAVFGISATRPDEVGQDIHAMAEHSDYVAPMVYPSHWGPGEYGVSNPNAEPYAIVHRSLKDFQKKTAGTNAQVFPWLQDFSLGVTYGVPQVDAQIKAAKDDGIDSFFLWDAGCDYHASALKSSST